MKNMPLTVITWRIGHSRIDTIESLLLRETKNNGILQSLYNEFGSIFYLETCQRIILVSSINNVNKANELRNSFVKASHNAANWVEEGELFVGSKALKHLAELVSSLDSIVIGEDQIQHQFKQAFVNCDNYLDQNLKQILQQVIRIGKRVRSRTIIGGGKTSMVSLIIEVYNDLIKNANSIGILGTGKMGLGVLNVTSQVNEAISIYSRKEERMNIDINGYSTKNFDDLQTHDVLFTATTVEMPLVTLDVIKKLGKNQITIFDLGMPRNCSLEINDLENVTLVGIEDLLKLSHHQKSSEEIANVYQVLQEEIASVLEGIIHKQKSTYYISLRDELSRIAVKYKDNFLKEDKQSEIKYQQLINKLIHVSQKHLQNALIETEGHQ
ncbi:MAG: Glutamyl-tRNA reductase [Candidatus Heimdallarchaeota archaeon LC_2]|nr:MAG: Glutamyl-tRNA reductase [Candidatus Heimdallarchaeota archaeon LC_2]